MYVLLILALFVKMFQDQIFTEKRVNVCYPPLPHVRLLEVEINDPATERLRELEEFVRWMAPSLEQLSQPFFLQFFPCHPFLSFRLLLGQQNQ